MPKFLKPAPTQPEGGTPAGSRTFRRNWAVAYYGMRSPPLCSGQVFADSTRRAAVTCLHSELSEYEDRVTMIRQGRCSMLYLSPEKLQTSAIIDLMCEQSVRIVIVDEVVGGCGAFSVPGSVAFFWRAYSSIKQPLTAHGPIHPYRRCQAGNGPYGSVAGVRCDQPGSDVSCRDCRSAIFKLLSLRTPVMSGLYEAAEWRAMGGRHGHGGGPGPRLNLNGGASPSMLRPSEGAHVQFGSARPEVTRHGRSRGSGSCLSSHLCLATTALQALRLWS
jgi:hypothetical protein